MKISQDVRMSVNNDRSNTIVRSQSSHSFGVQFAKNEQKLHIEQLNKFMSNIESAGQRLAKSRTFKDLATYKKLVKDFIHEAVEFGFELKQSHDWNYNGNSRTLHLVEKVDQELLTLTKDLVDQEKDSINILDKIGEIKGLLIDLYK
ncbi:YaaR family protein [Bacillus sp. PS06]|uniref:YaaR family protein n=1 Tax=Bacillus sp. PS06 TaxID=2764176 RepID=UPI00177FAD41|nr:YaaR family protein [Bacillus sp. PS06]MBD8071037.1 YaaR family protein [Bacillus sp. PS06]